MQRVRMLETLIAPVMLFGCPAWHLTSRERRQLRGVQLRMYTIVLHIHLIWTLGPAAHARHVRRYIKFMRADGSLTTWEHKYRESQ